MGQVIGTYCFVFTPKCYDAFQQLLESLCSRERLVAYGNPLLLEERSGSLAIEYLERVPLRLADGETFREERLQEVIDRAPNVLPVRDFYPAVTGLCSLGREIPVELSGRVGFIDNLLVTDDGHLVLVETKLWRNPEAVREVIAQALHYAMAITEISLFDLESAIRRGQSGETRLLPGQTIAARVQSRAEDGSLSSLTDDFEDALARFRQTGELLILVVADGVQVSVERLTRWLNEVFATTSPIKFGLVELRFFSSPSSPGTVVVPRTLLRTREISRHSIVVEVREHSSAKVSVAVSDSELDRPANVRSVRGAEAVLTKEALLDQVRKENGPEQLATVREVLTGLDALGLASKGLSSSTLQYGLQDGSNFLGIASFSTRYLWCQLPARLRARLGSERFIECKRTLNRVTNFYRPEDVDDPDKVNALTPRYEAITGKEREFVAAVGTVAALSREAIANS